MAGLGLKYLELLLVESWDCRKAGSLNSQHGADNIRKVSTSSARLSSARQNFLKVRGLDWPGLGGPVDQLNFPANNFLTEFVLLGPGHGLGSFFEVKLQKTQYNNPGCQAGSQR